MSYEFSVYSRNPPSEFKNQALLTVYNGDVTDEWLFHIQSYFNTSWCPNLYPSKYEVEKD